MKKICAFTLAETLTVLMIIGVIAVLLIPTLNSNVEKQKTVSLLKRLYASFSVNVQTVLSASNCASVSCLRAYSTGGIVSYGQNELIESVQVLDSERKPLYEDNGTVKMKDEKHYYKEEGHVFANPRYINVAKECKDYDCTPEGAEESVTCNACLPAGAVLPTSGEGEREKYMIYRLNNSSVMALYAFDGNCTTKGRLTVDGTTRVVCGIVVFDINGAKGPNNPGKDLFAYYISDEPVHDSYLVPIGYNNYKGIESTIRGGSCLVKANMPDGYNCTAKIMADGWKIEY